MRSMHLAAAVVAALSLAAPACAGSFVDANDFYADCAFDPSDHHAPVYIADQGPVFTGPGIYAHHRIHVPIYSAYAVVPRHGYPVLFPYVRRVTDARVIAPRVGIAPYAVSVYWPAPRRRVIR